MGEFPSCFQFLPAGQQRLGWWRTEVRNRGRVGHCPRQLPPDKSLERRRGARHAVGGGESGSGTSNRDGCEAAGRSAQLRQAGIHSGEQEPYYWWRLRGGGGGGLCTHNGWGAQAQTPISVSLSAVHPSQFFCRSYVGSAPRTTDTDDVAADQEPLASRTREAAIMDSSPLRSHGAAGRHPRYAKAVPLDLTASMVVSVEQGHRACAMTQLRTLCSI